MNGKFPYGTIKCIEQAWARVKIKCSTNTYRDNNTQLYASNFVAVV